MDLFGFQRRRQLREEAAAAMRDVQYREIDEGLTAAFDEATKAGDEVLAKFGHKIRKAEERKQEIAKAAGRKLNPSKLYASMRDAVSAAERRLYLLSWAKRYHESLLVGTALETLEQMDSRLEAIKNLRDASYSEYLQEAGLDLDALQAELIEAVTAWFMPRWNQMMTDRQAFFDLHPFVADQSGESLKYRFCRAKRLPYESIGLRFDVSEWNDAVARHIENPVVGDFVLTRTEFSAGEMLHRAAQALEDESLTEAKIVLAFCKYQRYFTEVGTLREELAKLVARLEKAHHK